MTYTASWAQPPSTGILGTVQLIGDVQTEWELIAGQLAAETTVYDHIGRDIRDNLTTTIPEVRVQVGDISNGDADLSLTKLQGRFNAYKAWLAKYNLDLYNVAGNHDLPGPKGGPPIFTVQQWATFFGYESHRFVRTFTGPTGAQYRVIFFSPSGIGTEMTPITGSFVPCRPFTAGDVTWLDSTIAASSLPTLVVTHAELLTPAQIADAQAAGGSYWRVATSTVGSGLAATEIHAVLDAYPQVIAWCHGHTHDPFNKGNVNEVLLDVGSRKIIQIDAGATFTRFNASSEDGSGGLYREPVTFYLSLLDDGRTIDTRWRHHEQRLWDGNSFGRVHRLTAT